MTGRFEDERGVIQDLFDGKPVDAITYIKTVKGAVRGNHFHKDTTQWTFLHSGSLLMVSGTLRTQMDPGECVKHWPGERHAWLALEDSECLVFTRGPRAGENYEADTYRLDQPLLP